MKLLYNENFRKISQHLQSYTLAVVNQKLKLKCQSPLLLSRDLKFHHKIEFSLIVYNVEKFFLKSYFPLAITMMDSDLDVSREKQNQHIYTHEGFPVKTSVVAAAVYINTKFPTFGIRVLGYSKKLVNYKQISTARVGKK